MTGNVQAPLVATGGKKTAKIRKPLRKCCESSTPDQSKDHKTGWFGALTNAKYKRTSGEAKNT